MCRAMCTSAVLCVPVMTCCSYCDVHVLMLVATADFVMFYTGSETPPVVMSGYMDALARTQRRACAQHHHCSSHSMWLIIVVAVHAQ